MKISIQRHLRSLMRDEFYRNWLIAIVVFVLVLIVVLIVAALTQDMEGALVAVLRSGTPSPSFPLAWHIWLGMLNTILITPFLLAAIIMTIRYWTERIQTGRKRYKSIKNHYVLIGYNRYSVSIIRNRLGQDGDSDALMILYTVVPPQTVRSELRALLPKALEERVIIYAGAPHLKEQIAQLNLHTAKAVYIALDGEDWNSSYARNISMLQTIAHYAGTQRVENHLPVNVLFNDDKAYEIAQRLELPLQCTGVYDADRQLVQNLDVHIYNFYENWARLLWSYSGFKKADGSYYYDRLDFEPLEGTDHFVHLVIVGFNSMGKALLKEAIRVCHYPNFDARKQIGKTLITIIDPEAERQRRQFQASYPYLAQIKDIEIDFRQAFLEDEDVRCDIIVWAKDERQLLTIAICVKDPDEAMHMSLSLPEAVYVDYSRLQLENVSADGRRARLVKGGNGTRTRILVRQVVRKNLQTIINENTQYFSNIKVFGTYYEGIALNLLDDKLPICIHGLYADKLYDNIDRISEIEKIAVQDHFERWKNSWYPLSEEERCANRYQIDMYRSTFAYMERLAIPQGTIIADPVVVERLAEVEHRRWIADKTLFGFRQAKTGEVRVDEVRIHNCIDDYSNLTRLDQIKDHAVVLSAPVLVTWADTI